MGRYTEVAVITSRTFSFTKFALRTAAGAAIGASVLLTGCQSSTLLSSPSDSRREGEQLYREGSYGEAAGSFKTAIRRNPRDYKSQYYLAQSYEQMGQNQQAIAAYKASLDTAKLTLEGKENKPFRLMTLDGLAGVIARTDAKDVELNLIEEKAKTGQSAENWFIVAKVYRQRGDVDSALDAYNRAALMDSKDFAIIKEYGLYLEQVGQTPKATQSLRKAYALNSSDPEVVAALRRNNIVPGPAVNSQTKLARPYLPEGPLPEVSRLGKDKQQPRTVRGAGPQPTLEPIQAQPVPQPQPEANIQAPRD
jgi:tetratricopeptide (TPR) repeat protein